MNFLISFHIGAENSCGARKMLPSPGRAPDARRPYLVGTHQFCCSPAIFFSLLLQTPKLLFFSSQTDSCFRGHCSSLVSVQFSWWSSLNLLLLFYCRFTWWYPSFVSQLWDMQAPLKACCAHQLIILWNSQHKMDVFSSTWQNLLWLLIVHWCSNSNRQQNWKLRIKRNCFCLYCLAFEQKWEQKVCELYIEK